MKQFRWLLLVILTILMTSLMGCNLISSAQIKMGLRNQDFDYIVNNDVDKIIIQSARDPGFRFIVTDQSAIKDIYDILKKGKIESEKTSLDPDYVLEIYIGKEVKKFNYVVNIDERGIGNFYDEDKIYDISNNLDQTITNNLSFIRKPKNFESIYYESILKVLDVQKDELTDENHKVGIDINSDVDCLKYMFSVDLEEFIKDSCDIVPNTQIINNNASEFDTVITVKNKGYSTKKFKTTITVDNQKDKSYKVYYVSGSYELKNWKITVSEPNEKPDNW